MTWERMINVVAWLLLAIAALVWLCTYMEWSMAWLVLVLTTMLFAACVLPWAVLAYLLTQ